LTVEPETTLAETELEKLRREKSSLQLLMMDTAL